jgi:hypothetical protein
MNKLSLFVFFLATFFLVNTGCNEGNDRAVGAPTEKPSAGTTPTVKKILSVEQYRLDNIFQQAVVQGTVYNYSSSQNLWCEQPNAALIMSYMRMNDIQSPNDLPDLNQYFDVKTTNDFNSCTIKVTDYGDFKDISLHYKGNLIYQNSLKVGEETEKIQTFKVAKLNNFNLPMTGSIDYSNGRNYVITIEDQKAKIVFSNEFGDYEMELLKIRKNNAVVSSEGMASVVSDRAYFHSQPDFSTKRKAFVVTGEQVRYSKTSGAFVYVVYFNIAGTKTQGWILKSDLTF